VLFSSLGLLGLIPWTHVLVVYYHNARVLTLLQDQLVMGVFYLSAATVYATRVPERWFPGTFDIWMHSHQIFHLLVLAGAYSHYLVAMNFLEWRSSSAGSCAVTD